ncbi:MAG TPA: hypothetical protein VM840_06090 [Actinomycetota bacterium]|nr:hypothetical protein [Actinomycetota bacterium]
MPTTAAPPPATTDRWFHFEHAQRESDLYSVSSEQAEDAGADRAQDWLDEFLELPTFSL